MINISIQITYVLASFNIWKRTWKSVVNYKTHFCFLRHFTQQAFTSYNTLHNQLSLLTTLYTTSFCFLRHFTQQAFASYNTLHNNFRFLQRFTQQDFASYKTLHSKLSLLTTLHTTSFRFLLHCIVWVLLE